MRFEVDFRARYRDTKWKSFISTKVCPCLIETPVTTTQEMGNCPSYRSSNILLFFFQIIRRHRYHESIVFSSFIYFYLFFKGKMWNQFLEKLSFDIVVYLVISDKLDFRSFRFLRWLINFFSILTFSCWCPVCSVIGRPELIIGPSRNPREFV